MSIHAVCECGKRFKAKDEYEGRRAICPSCRREFIFQRGGIPVFEEVRTESAEMPISTASHVDTRSSAARSDDTGRRLIVGMSVLFSAVIFAFWLMAWLTSENRPVSVKSSIVPDAIPIAPNPLYTITKDLVNQFMKKRIVDVELKQRPALDELQAIAVEIKGLDPTPYDYGFINFTIEGWAKDRGNWAMANWSNDFPLNVIIYGLSLKDERYYRTAPLDLPEGSHPLGTWLRDAQYGSGRRTIYERGGKCFWHLPSSGNDKVSALEMNELPSDEGTSLQIRGSSDVYTILPSGDLRLRNGSGELLFHLSPIVPPPPSN
jgi:hypothetical protein